MQFLPALLLTFNAGHAADRYNRKRIVQLCQWIEGLAAAYLAWGSVSGWHCRCSTSTSHRLCWVPPAAFERPAGAAMLPNIVPNSMLQQATALSTGAMHIASVGGPALGGFVFAFSPAAAYGMTAAFWLLAGVFNGVLPLAHRHSTSGQISLGSLFAGLHFVRKNPTLLGTISLDLFAVLLGGATALLPIFAKDILHTDALGLGLAARGARHRRADHHGNPGAQTAAAPRRSCACSRR